MKLKFLIIGAGDRGSNAYAKEIKENDLGEIIAVADPNKRRSDEFKKRYDIKNKNCFASTSKALNEGLGDIAIIATPDKTHRDIAVKALNEGYDILLEKPMGTTTKECLDIIEAQKKNGNILMLAHVLRYTRFYNKIKELIDKKEFGDLLKINYSEDIGNWHFAHSYVRGNWKNKESSGPIILTKSCHDMDIINWYMGEEIESIFSEGSLEFFKKENAPENSTERCINCPIKDCRYKAENIYLLNKKQGINQLEKKISTEDTLEARKSSLEKTDYGKCVWKCDNNVCDNQDVIIKFKNGNQACFNLNIGPSLEREIHLYFEYGKIIGFFHKGYIKKIEYGTEPHSEKREKIEIPYKSNHGGGDKALLENLITTVKDNKINKNKSTAEESLISHLMAFAAEKSRIENKTIDFKEYRENSK